MFDPSQQAIVELSDRRTLLLAGPGCGKTSILARRVLFAHQSLGMDRRKMLCLTFTNRAAREMAERIAAEGGEVPPGLFVGNLHRFGLRLLFGNDLIPADTTIITDFDIDDFAAANLRSRSNWRISRMRQAATTLYQQLYSHPAEAFLYKDDFSDEEMADGEDYLSFKQQNHLLDFDDILVQTYSALAYPPAAGLKNGKYGWIQVDEAQDISPLQFQIIQLLADDDAQVLFLGDEQQSIFSFLGAGGSVLSSIKKYCGGNLRCLTRNYRATAPLLDLTNSVARDFLDIDPDFLPQANSEGPGGDIKLYYEEAPKLLVCASALARKALAANSEGSVLILARTNREVAELSDTLARYHLEHVVLGPNDMFKSVAFNTIWSHLSVSLNPCSRHPWARLLYQTRSTRTLADARDAVQRLREAGMSPESLLDFDAPTPVELLVRECSPGGKTIVVLDCEATGLDVFGDDIVQIAALKIRDGEICSERFNVFIDSRRPLPQIDGAENPLSQRYATAGRQAPSEALEQFLEFLGEDSVICGHNLDFDLPLLRNNIRRLTGLAVPPNMAEGAEVLDTLTLSRLLVQDVNSHTLAKLADLFGIEHPNRHMAEDDALATARLLMHLQPLALTCLPLQYALREDRNFRHMSQRFSHAYSGLFRQARMRLFSPEREAAAGLAGTIMDTYLKFTVRGFIKEIPNIHYLVKLVEETVVNPDSGITLLAQLSSHLNDLLAYNEGDLYSYGIVEERIRIMTIHKAKGLEADTVIVANAGTAYGPAEDYLRAMYVAFSRSRRNLYVGTSSHKVSLLQSLRKHFSIMKDYEVGWLINGETWHSLEGEI